MPTADRGHELNDRGDARFTSFDSHHATKIYYMSPSFSGFQAGVSYAPESDSNGENVVFSSTASDFRNVFETALAYTGEFNSVSVAVAGNYNFAEAQSGFEDLSSWTLGLKLGYNGFSIGGGYTDDGDSGNTAGVANDNITSWNIGATYENGPWGVGISYLDRDFDNNGDATSVLGSDGNGGSYTAWVMGGTYTVAPGLTVGADLAFYDRNRNTGTDTDGYVLVTDATAAF